MFSDPIFLRDVLSEFSRTSSILNTSMPIINIKVGNYGRVVLWKLLHVREYDGSAHLPQTRRSYTKKYLERPSTGAAQSQRRHHLDLPLSEFSTPTRSRRRVREGFGLHINYKRGEAMPKKPLPLSSILKPSCTQEGKRSNEGGGIPYGPKREHKTRGKGRRGGLRIEECAS